MSKSSTFIIVLLLIIIGMLGWLLWVKTAEAPSAPAVSTSTSAAPGNTTDDGPVTIPAPKPLHDRVLVTYPTAKASVPKKFTITGKAPGNWFFEASAPYMVTTPDGDKVARGTLQTLSDWMTTELVDFKADVSVNPAYSGPATLVLMKDNPSGLPENEDSLEIPIVVQ